MRMIGRRSKKPGIDNSELGRGDENGELRCDVRMFTPEKRNMNKVLMENMRRNPTSCKGESRRNPKSKANTTFKTSGAKPKLNGIKKGKAKLVRVPAEGASFSLNKGIIQFISTQPKGDKNLSSKD